MGELVQATIDNGLWKVAWEGGEGPGQRLYSKAPQQFFQKELLDVIIGNGQWKVGWAGPGPALV